jgi:hypothetical protein
VISKRGVAYHLGQECLSGYENNVHQYDLLTNIFSHLKNLYNFGFWGLAVPTFLPTLQSSYEVGAKMMAWNMVLSNGKGPCGYESTVALGQ